MRTCARHIQAGHNAISKVRRQALREAFDNIAQIKIKFYHFHFCLLFLGYGGLQWLRQQESVRHRQGHYHAIHVR